MRTTVTLEDGLVLRLRAAARKRNLSFKEVVNEALRKGLQITVQPKITKPFRVRPLSMGVKAGFEYDKINQFLDDEEAENAIPKQGKSK